MDKDNPAPRRGLYWWRRHSANWGNGGVMPYARSVRRGSWSGGRGNLF